MTTESANILRQHTDLKSPADIDNLYRQIVNTIDTVTRRNIPKSKFRHYLKPYWNQELTMQHNQMKSLRQQWISDGRPRGSCHTSYTNYKQSKCKFRQMHRRAVDAYDTQQLIEIDKTLEVDSASFWREINKRRNYSRTSPGAEMKFGETTYRQPEEITTQWGHYFANLYSPLDIPSFDDSFKTEIESYIRDQDIETESINSVSDEEIYTGLKSCKSGKACGEDNIYYEKYQIWRRMPL